MNNSNLSESEQPIQWTKNYENYCSHYLRTKTPTPKKTNATYIPGHHSSSGVVIPLAATSPFFKCCAPLQYRRSRYLLFQYTGVYGDRKRERGTGWAAAVTLTLDSRERGLAALHPLSPRDMRRLRPPPL